MDQVEARVEVGQCKEAIYTLESFANPHSCPSSCRAPLNMSEAIPSFTAEHTLSERSIKENNRERKKRVVVTGGSGKLGRCVVREMAEHGWEVYNRESRSP
jgi:hypothetical protein